MGTNYYWKNDKDTEIHHIGKSSGGWCFSLRLHPDLGIMSLRDWEKIWAGSGLIEDEYGLGFSKEEMLTVILQRGRPHPLEHGFNFEMNHAAPGPNNLVRHKVDDHCIGWGDGTYDLIVGEFC
jgi:hypothetical protein